jgi:hypothetical protein
MCVESQLDLMLPYFRLRQEARKSWDYLFTDSLVYCPEILNGNGDPFLLISEYDHGFHWLELHIRLVGEVEEYLSVIIECLGADRLRGSGGEVVISDHRMKRDMAMFVDAPQHIQKPKVIEPVGIPTLVRLQRSNSNDGLIRHPECGFSESNLIVQSVLSVNREANSLGLGISADLRNELPRQMIEGRSKAADKIPGDQSTANIHGRRSHINDILASFKIIVREDALIVEFVPIFYELTQGIQVNLRPGNLVHYGANW